MVELLIHSKVVGHGKMKEKALEGLSETKTPLLLDVSGCSYSVSVV